MDINTMLRYAFVNNCEVTFSQEINQLAIVVVMFNNTKRKKVMKQYLPLSDHTYPEKVKDCIDFMVGTLKATPMNKIGTSEIKNFKTK